MVTVSLEEQILEGVRKLNDVKKRQVLEYTRSLSRPPGTPGKLAVQIAREIGFSPEDLAEMQQAIDEWCERVDDSPLEVKFDE